MKYEKLVRDKIPELISSKGERPVTRVLSPGEFVAALKAKLLEEVQEFTDSSDIGELADILEVLYALAADAGVRKSDLEQMRQSKFVERGGFSKRLMLLETTR